MDTINTSYSTKSGLPPGSLVYVGDEAPQFTPYLRIIEYSATEYTESVIKEINSSPLVTSRNGTVWISVVGIHNTDLIKKIGQDFELHPLMTEDILNTQHFPKIEEFEDCFFAVLKPLLADHVTGLILNHHVAMVLRNNVVISFHEYEKDIFEPVRERLKKSRGAIRKEGGGYLFYSLLDTVIDGFFGAIESVEEKIEQVEQDLSQGVDEGVGNEINLITRNLIFLRKHINPLKDPIKALPSKELGTMNEENEAYLRDLYDHILNALNLLGTYREHMTAVHNRYMASLTIKANEVMKTLTVFSAVFIPLTFFSSVYGMNFKYMPELDWKWGYPTFLFCSAFLTLLMFFYFRRKKYW